MKRIMAAFLLTVLTAVLLTGCGSKTPDAPSEPSETVPPSTSEEASSTPKEFTITVKTSGNGFLAFTEKDREPTFNDEYPSLGLKINCKDSAMYTFAAKPDKGAKFVKWTLNGKEYSKAAKITVTVSEETELVAVFDNA